MEQSKNMSNIQKPKLDSCSEKEFNNWFWSEYNQFCIKCDNNCKQSHMVNLIGCPKRILKKGEVDDVKMEEEIS